LTFPNSQVVGLEIATDRLLVIVGHPAYPTYYPWGCPAVWPTSRVDLALYDVTDLAAPRLMQNVSMAGSYVAARLAGGYVYAVIQQPSYVFDGQGNATAVMPTASQNGDDAQLAPTSVYYTPIPSQISYYTMIPSIDMSTGKESVVSVLTGPSATVYVSTSNIYVVYTNYLDLYDVDNIPGNYWSGGVVSPQAVQQSQNSTVLRVEYVNGVRYGRQGRGRPWNGSEPILHGRVRRILQNGDQPIRHNQRRTDDERRRLRA